MAETKMLDRKESAIYCTDRGYRTSYNTLMKLACTGGGPTFRKFGGRVIYAPEDLDTWIASRLSPPLISTSEAA